MSDVVYELHAHLPRHFARLDPRRYLEVYIKKLMEVEKPSLFEVRITDPFYASIFSQL